VVGILQSGRTRRAILRIGSESAKLECAHPGLMKVGFEGKTQPMCRAGIGSAPVRERGGKGFPRHSGCLHPFRERWEHR